MFQTRQTVVTDCDVWIYVDDGGGGDEVLDDDTILLFSGAWSLIVIHPPGKTALKDTLGCDCRYKLKALAMSLCFSLQAMPLLAMRNKFDEQIT